MRRDLLGVDLEVGAISLVSADFQAPCGSLSHSDKNVVSLSFDLKEFRSAARYVLRHYEAERGGDFRYVLFLTELVSKTRSVEFVTQNVDSWYHLVVYKQTETTSRGKLGLSAFSCVLSPH